MGCLTEEMTRLCGEIVALRGARKSSVKSLRQNVSAMQSGFSYARAKMAKKTKAERRAFVANLKKTVAGMRQEFAADLDGARRAWSGR